MRRIALPRGSRTRCSLVPADAIPHAVLCIALCFSLPGCEARQQSGAVAPAAAEDVVGAASGRAEDSLPTSNADGPKADEDLDMLQPEFEHLRGQSPVVDRALGLKATVDAANRDDLHLLWTHVQDLLRPLDADARRRLARQVKDRIAADAALLKGTQAYFREGPGKSRWWEALELRKAVDQLLGAPGEFVGIYDDARGLLARPESSNPFNPQLAELYLEPPLTAGMKTLLIYTAVTAAGRNNAGDLPLIRDLQLLYAVELPESLPRELVDGVTLVDLSSERPRFLIPNAGFVMGGTFQDRLNRGIDCSAFVSHCTRSSDRLTTWVMEFCWRELARGIDDFTDEELEVRKEFLEKWGLNEALVDFEAIEFDALDDLQPGDLIVRRWHSSKTGKREGNSTLFLAPRPNGTVWGIECNRLDNPNSGERFDGIIERVYDLFQPKVHVYVLRRRE